MTNIVQLCEHLELIADRGHKSGEQLKREQGYISETIQKTQSLFADQKPGQTLINELYRLINTLSSAESAANALHDRIAPYISLINK